MHMFEYDGDTNTATFMVDDSSVEVRMDFEQAFALDRLFNKSSAKDRRAGADDVLRHVAKFDAEIAT